MANLFEKSQSVTDQSLQITQSLIAQSYTIGQTVDENVFISKYELNIPSKERMAEFLRQENEGLSKEDKR